MKRIIITGASSGLGYDLACYFASRGHRVGAVARRLDRLEALRDRYPDNIIVETIDITAVDAPQRLQAFIDRMGGLDIFIQGAGMGKQNPGLDPELERRTVMTNCVGFTAMVATAFNHFRAHPTHGATIAAITSVAGTNGLGNAATYSASKRYDSTYLTALEQLSHLEGVRISFVDIRPGFIATELLNPENKYPMLMTREHAVPLIARAIERRKRVATVDWKWRLLIGFWRLLPRWLWVRFPARTSRKS